VVTTNRSEEVIKMHTLSTPLSKEQKHAHDEIAAVLSIVPGLGHIYKGHWEAGLLWMFVGMPIAMFVGIISILGTAGVGLLFPIVCWVALAFDAYNEKNRRHHHLTSTWADDDESQD
jgi:Zn-dependent protease with chaperone function